VLVHILLHSRLNKLWLFELVGKGCWILVLVIMYINFSFIIYCLFHFVGYVALSCLVQCLQYSQSQSHITTDGQSVIISRYRVHSGTCDQILLSVRRLFSEICCLVFLGRSLWREVGSVICLSQSSKLPLFTSNIYVTCVFQFSNLYAINIKLQSVTSDYSNYALLVIISLDISQESRHLNGRINDCHQV
jgi:hypothetical protein